MTNDPNSPSRLELLIAFCIAIVSITAAVVAWRSSALGSMAGDATRKSLIEATKKEAGDTENWRRTYQEAAFAQLFTTYEAEAKSLEGQSGSIGKEQAVQIQQYLLPVLKQISPISNDARYQKPEGTYNLQQRFDDLQAESPDLANINPATSSQLADQYYSEQRWLVVAVVLLTIGLFWLTMAQISRTRLQKLLLFFGLATYLLGLVWSGAVELIYLVMRGSL